MCQCGCGTSVGYVKRSRPERGLVAGQPQRFARGHKLVSRRPLTMSLLEDRLAAPDAKGCRLWAGARSKAGYGSISVNGEAFYVHRLVWEINNGPIPPGRQINHRCDEPACGEISHLFLGSHAANTADMMSKGRGVFPTGQRNGRAKLTAAQVEAIRTRYAQGGISMERLGAIYNVSDSTINSVVNRVTWRDPEAGL